MAATRSWPSGPAKRLRSTSFSPSSYYLARKIIASNALVSMVTGSNRVYVFGVPYSDPDPYPGMHDVHMNQGDPIASAFHPLDGIWQDGCVIVDGGDSGLAGYFGKFATQSLTTDSNGWPT
jgi:uncharacterized protein YukJ